MNELEQLHLDAIKQFEHHCTPLKDFASKSAEITEQIAIEFAKYIDASSYTFTEKNIWESFANEKSKSTEEIFQEFLKNKQ